MQEVFWNWNELVNKMDEVRLPLKIKNMNQYDEKIFVRCGKNGNRKKYLYLIHEGRRRRNHNYIYS